MNDLSQLESFGLSWPSPGYIAGSILFGLLGWAAYRYGKKAELPRVKWGGVALMVYPYAVSQTWLLWLVGGALCGWVWWEAQ
jgi:hypothetical protein